MSIERVGELLPLLLKLSGNQGSIIEKIQSKRPSKIDIFSTKKEGGLEWMKCRYIYWSLVRIMLCIEIQHTNRMSVQ